MSLSTGCLLDRVGRPLRYAATNETLSTAGQFTATKSVVFNGAHVLNVGDALHFERTTPISVSAFIKTLSSAWQAILFSYPNIAPAYRGWMFGLYNTKFSISLNSDYSTDNKLALNGTNAVTDGNWHHIVLTYSGSSTASGFIAYLDNNSETLSVSTDSLTGTVVTTAPGTIGAAGDTGISARFVGSLCHMSVWNRVLTAAEVGILYNGKKPQDLRKLSFFDACTNWWKLGDSDTWPVCKDSVGVLPAMMTGMSASNIATDSP